MGIYTEAIQKLYVAYFNRPADAFGLQNWESLLNDKKVTLADVSKAFAGSDEYKKAYAGMDALHVVAQVYLNLFNNSNPDTAGLLFWATKLQSGVLSIDTIVQNIADGAQGTDKDAYTAKVAAATAFTAQLDTAAEMLGYSGDAANAMAKTWMSTIKDDASLKAAIADAALSATVVSITNPPVPGQTFSLSQGLDTIVGTAGDDVINAYAFNNLTGAITTTMQSVDTIDGGKGNDTLNIEINGANNNGLAVGSVTNVETININESQGTPAAAVNGSAFVGAKVINQIGASVDVTKLAAGTTAGFQTVTLDAVANRTVAAASSASSAAVNFGAKVLGSAANIATLNVTGDSLSSVTVTGALTKVDPTSTTNKLNLNVTAGTDASGKSVASLAVNTSVTTALTVTEQGTGHIATIDASGSTGAVTFSGTAFESTIKGGAGKDSLTLNTVFTSSLSSATIDGGAGNDTIVVRVDATGAAGNFTALGGDGNDTIDVRQIDVVAGNKIDGGAGTDTLKFGNPASFAAGDYVLLANVVSNVETLRLTSGVTSLDASKVSQFSTLSFDADSTGVTKVAQSVVSHASLTASGVGYLSAAATGDVAAYAGDLKITVDTNAKTITALADTATINVDTTGKYASISDTIKGDLQTGLTVNVVNSTDGDSPAGADYAATATIAVDGANKVDGLSALKSLTLKGDGTVFLTSTGSAKLATIDASALGGTLKLSGIEGTITGGLNFTSNAAVAESVTLGSGHDMLTINSTYSKMDTITGFDANKETTSGDSTNDVLTFAGKTLGDGSHTVLNKVALTAAESTLDLAFIKAAAASHAGAVAGIADVVFFQFGGNTYLFQDANNNGILDNSDLAVKLVGTFDLTKDFAVHATPAV